jgi:hypothetical protein
MIGLFFVQRHWTLRAKIGINSRMGQEIEHSHFQQKDFDAFMQRLTQDTALFSASDRRLLMPQTPGGHPNPERQERQDDT